MNFQKKKEQLLKLISDKACVEGFSELSNAYDDNSIFECLYKYRYWGYNNNFFNYDEYVELIEIKKNGIRK